MINVTNYVGDRGRFNKLMTPVRKKKPWEVEWGFSMQNLSQLKKGILKKDKIILQLKQEIKQFEY